MTQTIKRLMLLLLLPLAAVALYAAHTVATVPNVHVADRTQYVSNPDGVLSPEAVTQLNSLLAKAWQESTAEPVIVALDDIDTDDVDGFATELFGKWGIGKKDNDNGVLMLIVRDKRKAVIRTGYGAEGVVPDVIAGRILREDMFPRFREGDYDGGTLAATNRLVTLLTDPEAARELHSSIASDSRSFQAVDFSGEDLWHFYLWLSFGLALAMTGWVAYTVISSRREDELQRYVRLNNIRSVALFIAFFTLGMGVPALLWVLVKMRRLRNHPRTCPNCGTQMVKLDEETDNQYLTPAQDTEELIDSIDYDVWLCPNCHTTDIIPYVKRGKNYTVCERCGGRTCEYVGSRTVTPPTVTRKGVGERMYMCHNCHHRYGVTYNIPKLPPVVIVPSGGGRGFGGGGGFSGGSFGGGMTGGGGASGGW
ncbi:MAG: TPM domain-containing protein [Bacteroides sp.]|nr:TPM domain-containing protein [Bacteroidales bacterium]MBD5316001.1 TPM domain-containing protein [Bacteroides sp.]